MSKIYKKRLEQDLEKAWEKDKEKFIDDLFPDRTLVCQENAYNFGFEAGWKCAMVYMSDVIDEYEEELEKLQAQPSEAEKVIEVAKEIKSKSGYSANVSIQAYGKAKAYLEKCKGGE